MSTGRSSASVSSSSSSDSAHSPCSSRDASCGRITSHRLSQGVIREPRLVRSLANSGLPTALSARRPFRPGSWTGAKLCPRSLRHRGLGTRGLRVDDDRHVRGQPEQSRLASPPLRMELDDAMLSSFAGAEDFPSHQSAVLLNHDSDIAAWSGVSFTQGRLMVSPFRFSRKPWAHTSHHRCSRVTGSREQPGRARIDDHGAAP